MGLCQTVGFAKEFPVGGDDNDHLHQAVGMEVLIVNHAQKSGRGVCLVVVEDNKALCAIGNIRLQCVCLTKRGLHAHRVVFPVGNLPQLAVAGGVGDFQTARHLGREGVGSVSGFQLPRIMNADVVETRGGNWADGEFEGVSFCKARRWYVVRFS